MAQTIVRPLVKNYAGSDEKALAITLLSFTLPCISNSFLLRGEGLLRDCARVRLPKPGLSSQVVQPFTP